MTGSGIMKRSGPRLAGLENVCGEQEMNPTSVPDTIVQEITIDGSAEQVFEALTSPQRNYDSVSLLLTSRMPLGVGHNR